MRGADLIPSKQQEGQMAVVVAVGSGKGPLRWTLSFLRLAHDPCPCVALPVRLGRPACCVPLASAVEPFRPAADPRAAPSGYPNVFRFRLLWSQDTFLDTTARGGNRHLKSTLRRKQLFWRIFLRVSYAHFWQFQSSYHNIEVCPKLSQDLVAKTTIKTKRRHQREAYFRIVGYASISLDTAS